MSKFINFGLVFAAILLFGSPVFATNYKIVFTDPWANITAANNYLQNYTSAIPCLNGNNFTFVICSACLDLINNPGSATAGSKAASFYSNQPIQLEIGPKAYYNAAYFGSAGITTIQLQLPSSYRLAIMNKIVNKLIPANPAPTVAVIFSYRQRPPLDTLSSDNYGFPFLTDFKGQLRYFVYNSDSDIATILQTIWTARIYNIIVYLNRAPTDSVITQALQRNLFTWKYRWLVFFGSVARRFINGNINRSLISSNITLIELSILNQTNLGAGIQSDIEFSDAANVASYYFQWKLCTQPLVPPILTTINTGSMYWTSSTVVSQSSWRVQVFSNFQNNTADISQTTVTLASDGTPTVDLGNLTEQVDRVFDLQAIQADLNGRTLRVVAILEPPFVYYTTITTVTYPDSTGNATSHNSTDNTTSPNSTTTYTTVLTGLSVELMNTICRALNVTPQYTVFTNLTYGTKHRNGQWSGLMALIQSGSVDIAIGPLTLTLSRKAVVDTTIPYLVYQNAILIKETRPSTLDDMFQFTWPFNRNTWLLILGTTLAYGICLGLLHLISPNRRNFNAYHSVFFAFGTLVQGVTVNPPDKSSGRVIVIFWCFFSLIMVLTYVANYGAYRTSLRLAPRILAMSDLLTQQKYRYSVVNDSSLDEALMTSTYQVTQQVNLVMRSQYSNLLFSSTSQAINEVSKGTFALIIDEPIALYYQNVLCMTDSASFDQNSYVFMLPKGSDYTPAFDKLIQTYIDNDTISSLYSQFVTGTPNNTCYGSSWLDTVVNVLSTKFLPQTDHALNIQNTLGIFFILACGCILSLLVAGIEAIVRTVIEKTRKPKDESTA